LKKIKIQRLFFFLIINTFRINKEYNLYGRNVLFSGEREIMLKKLLKTARKNVPYVKTHLPEVEQNENLLKNFNNLNFETQKLQLKNDLSKFLDPSIIRRDKVVDFKQKNILTLIKLFKKDIVFPMSTGGSTGAPLNFYIDKNRGLKFLMQLMAIAKYIGWVEGETFMACMQGGMYQQSNFVTNLLRWIGSPSFVYKELNIEIANIFKYQIEKQEPVILMASPSFLSQMSILFEKNGIKYSQKLKGIICIGEMLFEHQRKIIERCFETKIYNTYASNEIGVIAVECNEHQGLHILEGSVFLENDSNLNILATAYDSYCLPFIKYQTGDVGQIVYQECLCGIKGNKIINLKGRVEEYLINNRGEHIHASYLRQLLINANHKFDDVIVNGKFYQKKGESIHYEIQIKHNKFGEEIIIYLRNEIWRQFELDSRGKITNSIVPEIGKFRFFYRED
jgi:phenylacetate-CoA ligase